MPAISVPNQRVAELLREMAYAREVEGNAWSAKAYRHAAGIVNDLARPASEYTHKQLCAFDGIGRKLATLIRSMAEGHTPKELQQAQHDFPPSVLTLTRIVGVGEKRAIKLYRKYGYPSYDALLDAVEKNLIPDKRLCDAVRASARLTGRVPWHTASRTVHALVEHLSAGRKLRIQAVGSYRRRKDSVGDIDLLFTSRFPRRTRNVQRRFLAAGDSVISSGDYKSSIYYRIGDSKLIRVDLLVVDPSAWGAALCYFTGSAAHNIALRRRAIEFGLVLNEHGVWAYDRNGDPIRVAGSTERSVYNALGVVPTPPVYRTGRLRLQTYFPLCPHPDFYRTVACAAPDLLQSVMPEATSDRRAVASMVGVRRYSAENLTIDLLEALNQQ